MSAPIKDGNRLVYPFKVRKAQRVETLGASRVKEDIILNEPSGDNLELEYGLQLPDGLEARQETDGSIGVYGVAGLTGDVSTGTEKDAELLQKARQNAEKTQLLFRMPAPFIKESNKHTSTAKAWYSLDGAGLTLHAANLKQAQYPLTIDPSVYIETAAKLMRGNNETNTDFDVTNELIQKSQTTGARIDAWSSTTSLNTAMTGMGMAAAGGYIYEAGGIPASTLNTQTYYTAGSNTWQVPSGVTTITVKAWGAGGGGGCGSGSSGVGGAGGGGGYASAYFTVSPLENLTVEVGTGGARCTTNLKGGNGGGSSQVKRSATYLIQAGGGAGGGGTRGTSTGGAGGAGGGATAENGTQGGGGGGGGGTAGSTGSGGTGGSAVGTAAAGINGAANAGGNAASNSTGCANQQTGTGGAGGTGAGGAGGQNTTSCANGGGGGGGRFGGGGGGSSGNNNDGGGGGGGGSNLLTGTTILSSTGVGVTPANSSDTDRNGNADGGTGSTSTSTTAGDDGAVVIQWYTSNTPVTTVNWAHFNTTSQAIDLPNPGNGTCASWCNNSAYNLPAARSNASLVAYNGFLYCIGGSDSSGNPVTTVYIAKLGANGEPQLWHPTNTSPGSWVYWYTDTALGAARSMFGAVAYNNRMYILGGLTTSSTLLTTNTVQYADINPTGTLGTLTSTGMQAITGGTGRFGHSVQVYNDTMYIIGGDASISGSPLTTVEYSKLNSDGTMNAWQTGNSFTTGRMTAGGSFSTIWGAYIYLAGGCITVSSGACTASTSSIQLASINADGSIAPWNTIIGLTINRVGHSLIAWQNGLYRFGGCSAVIAFGGCSAVDNAVEYGVINNDGDASTVSNSDPSGSGTCTGGSPYNCDLPTAGDGAGQGGQMSSMMAINNGYIYNIGGCVDPTTSCDADMSGNIAYAALNSIGQMVAPANCPGTSYGLWCVDSTNQLNGTTGLGAAGIAVFNNVIYVVGGTTPSAWQSNVYRVGLNTDGSLNGAWQSQTLTGLGLTGTADDARGYMYVFTRANPGSASTVPGNLYMLGGCSGSGGIGCSTYFTEVIKCNIQTDTTLASCTTTGQMQIDADNVNAGSQGLGLMAGTVYANRVYLVGGACPQTGATASAPCGATYAANRKDTIYASIDASNNIVDTTTGSSGGSWAFATAQMNPVRRRAVSFGYNGYIYSLAGYSGSASLQDLLFSKIDVSTGDMGTWDSSGVVVTPRWDLRAIVSNGYVYAVGGCGTGAAPNACTAMQPQVQTFQLYNNDSGAPISYAASANQFTTDRFGAGSVVLNGYLYVAGGCISTGDCTDATNSVQYAAIDNYGAIGSWSATTANLPADRAWGKLVAAGGSLYFLGGQDDAAAAQNNVYYATPSSGNVSSWATATNQLTAARAEFGAKVWDNRIYVAGGKNSGTAQNQVWVSPQLNSGGNITSAWSTASTSFNVARWGLALVAYANNLYIMGGTDGTNYLNDVQFASIGYKTGTIAQSGTTVTGTGTTFTSAMVGSRLQYPDGSFATITAYSSGTSITVDVSKSVAASTKFIVFDGQVYSWSYTTSLPEPIVEGSAYAANGYLYLVGGRSQTGDCVPNTLVTPISANTTIATGNNPTGIGEWYETNVKYTGDRYGNSVAYSNGKLYVTGGACESFPTVSSITTTSFGSDATTHNVSMPSGTVNSGDLLICLFTNDGNATVTTPGGWTALTNGTQTRGANVRGSVYAKSAAGTEGGTTVNFQTSATEQAAAQVYRIPAGKWRASGTLLNDVEVANVDPGADTNAPNPPSLNPTNWGTENTLWIAYAAGSSYATVTTYPTSYDNATHTTAGSGTTGATASSARHTSLTAAEDPAAYAMPSTSSGVAFTIGVRPATFAMTGANRAVQTAVYSQPQLAKYSRLIDTDTDVFPTKFLMNGIDNSVGSRWQAQYRSSTAATGSWGQNTNFGDVSLGTTNTYTPKDSGGTNTNFARYYYFSISIDSSQTFGYPEDVTRGPTMTDLTLFFTADPSKRLRHGKTFTGGELQPLDTPPP